MKALLQQIWRGESLNNSFRKSESSYGENSTFFGKLKKIFLDITITCKKLVQNKIYSFCICSLILLAASLELYDITFTMNQNIGWRFIVYLLLQIIFTIDILLKFTASNPNYYVFCMDTWNQFDGLLIVLLWIDYAFEGTQYTGIIKLMYL